MSTIERLCDADAGAIDGRGLDWIVAETEDPYRNIPGADFDTFTRLRVMDRLRFRMLDFRYVQPALSPTQAPAENLLLIARPCQGAPDTIPRDVVSSILAEYMRWAMRIDDPTENSEYRRMSRAISWRHSIDLVEFDTYLGWDKQLRVVDVAGVDDPEFAGAVAVYKSAYSDPETCWPADIFRSAVERKPALAAFGYSYHLWGIHSTEAGPCDGMASFVTMPTAGFGGYLAFDRPLRNSGRLRHVIARIEERMVRDNPDSGGWYLECNTDINRETFAKVGFFELDVPYEQPATAASGSRTPALSLHLLYKPFGSVYRPPVIPRDEFLTAVAEIYSVIYEVDAQSDPSYRRLEESLGTTPTVSAVRVGSVVDINTGDHVTTVVIDALIEEKEGGGTGFAGSPIPGRAGWSDGKISGRLEQVIRVVGKSEAPY